MPAFAALPHCPWFSGPSGCYNNASEQHNITTKSQPSHLFTSHTRVLLEMGENAFWSWPSYNHSHLLEISRFPPCPSSINHYDSHYSSPYCFRVPIRVTRSSLSLPLQLLFFLSLNLSINLGTLRRLVSVEFGLEEGISLVNA